MIFALTKARDGPSAGRSRTVLGFGILAFVAMLAALHPVLQATVWASQANVYHPEVGFDIQVAHPSGFSARHPLGTDPLGRDVLSQLTFALRPTLLVVVASAVTVAVLGTVAGAAAAFWRGKTEAALTHLSDAMALLPPSLAMLVVGVGRPDFGPTELGVLYGAIFGLGPGAAAIRAQGLLVMAQPFMDAARTAGGGGWWNVRKHLFPHLLPLVAVQVASAVIGAIVVEGFIEYLGAAQTRLGLGSLVYAAITYQRVLRTGVPWYALLAGTAAITLLVAAFYMISTGLREAFDPRLRNVT